MKYLKAFESYDEVPDIAREVFEIWTRIADRGCSIPVFNLKLDWDQLDFLDSPDSHVRTYSAEATDEDGLDWQVEMDVVDGHFREINYDYLELADSSSKKFDAMILNMVKSLDPSAKYEGIKINGDNRWIIKTKIDWTDFVNLFDTKEREDKEDLGYELKFRYELIDGDDTLDVYYRKPKNSPGYFSL
jgi:hypothetical protein